MVLDTCIQEKTASSANGIVKTESTCARIKPDPYLWPFTKNNSEWIEDLNVWLETSKMIRKTINKKFQDVGISKNFLIRF